MSDAQLTERARRQATKFGAEMLTARDVTGLGTHGPARVRYFGDGGRVAAHVVVIATDAAYRDPDVPGARALTGSGLYSGSAFTEAADSRTPITTSSTVPTPPARRRSSAASPRQ